MKLLKATMMAALLAGMFAASSSMNADARWYGWNNGWHHGWYNNHNHGWYGYNGWTAHRDRDYWRYNSDRDWRDRGYRLYGSRWHRYWY